MASNGTHIGTLKWFDLDKGFGFLVFEGRKKDVYIHRENSRKLLSHTPKETTFGNDKISKEELRLKKDQPAKIVFVLADGERGAFASQWGFLP